MTPASPPPASPPALPTRISVVIPHLNQPQMLARCLDSLAAATRRPDEVIVVDNGSRERPEAVCAAPRPGLGGVLLLSEPTPGPGPARNRGVVAATGDVLAFIDADCLADPGWLLAAEAALADPGAAILGGDVRIAVRDPARLTMIEAYESEYAYRMDRYIAREGFTGTGNLVVRRAAMEAVGAFRGLEVAEDRDWGQRATAQGWRILYVPGMRVYHPARPDLGSLLAKWDRHVAHDFERACARQGGRALFAAKALAMLVSPLAELPRVARSDRVAGPANRVRALGALARVRAHRARRMAWLLAGGDPDRLTGRWNRA